MLESPKPESIDILDIQIWNPDYEEFRGWLLREVMDRSQTTLLGIANAHTLNLATEQKAYKETLQKFNKIINDGAGMAMAAKMQGEEFEENFNGTDLIPRLFRQLDRPLSVFLYGASEESNAGTAEEIRKKYKQVALVGRIHGFVTPEEALSAISASDADLLLVALGQPKQEFFIQENQEKLNVRVACGVGALFDFMSGNVNRAPEFFRNLHIEWVYRLLIEPKRMFARYVIGNPKFLIRAKRHAKKLKKSNRS